MTPKSAYKKLQTFGYSRSDERIDLIQHGKPTPHRIKQGESYKGKVLNHTVMERFELQECDYAEACVTGSIFRSCKFVNCIFDQADFEFCEFYDCEFVSGETMGISFNNSSFINTKFRDINFQSCTFTSAFFQNCLFDKAQITVSTLEGALFKSCSFSNVDYRNLNMDFVDIDMPQMDNVVLPMDQIPFVFGALQYLKRTTDNVSISKGDYEMITPYDFFQTVVPLLCIHFKKTEQYFPLANIYYALEDKEQAHQAIQDGLISSMAMRDFRLLKYFCKLVAFSGAYQPSALHSLYNNYICRLFLQNGMDQDIPNYSRHIWEIKDVLFSAARRPTIRMAMRTDISLEENHKLGKLLECVFSLGKMPGSFKDNDVKAVLQQNSPLIITVSISGDELQLSSLLRAFLLMAGISTENQAQLPVVAQYQQLALARTDYECNLHAMANAHRKDLLDHSIHISMLEYYVENFNVGARDSENYYYFNSSAMMPENASTL